MGFKNKLAWQSRKGWGWKSVREYNNWTIFQLQGREDKQIYLSQECQQVEEYNNKTEMRDIFKKDREITGKCKTKIMLKNNNNGR